MTMKMELEELFLRKKPVKLLMALKTGISGKYVSVLSKETDCTYSHTVKLLEEFKNLGLVSFDKKGRVKFIKLTADGEELAVHFESVLRKFTKLKPKKVEKPPEIKKKAQPPLPPVQTKPSVISKPAPPPAKPLPTDPKKKPIA
jgi:DNA-binding transcriptional ArsR family regulator